MNDFDILTDSNLKNSFSVPSKVKELITVNKISCLTELYNSGEINKNTKIAGHGYNSIPKSEDESTFIKIAASDIEIVKSEGKYVCVKVGAGCGWDNFVKWSVENNYHGLENMSFIPGSVGAAPIHNIGAYGYEVSTFIVELSLFDLENGKFVTYKNIDCDFKYRTSIFKLAPNLLICDITFKIYKDSKYVLLAIEDKEISKYEETKELINLLLNSFTFNFSLKPLLKFKFDSVRDILKLSIIPTKLKRKLVKKIRTKVLPNPEVIGNSGCFFKCPILTNEQFINFKSLYPQVEYFESEEGYKISACWLIRGAGWAGRTKNGVHIDANKPVLLLNYDSATSENVLLVSNEIIENVMDKFKIKLETEAVFY
ncbi:FAD-binding protein [Pseudoalteromonas ulvae]|uniref:UDP-N-acetylenolpyruvoylglucosamine reductase n=1 Tax=Pseudoalteromonas ulvae TaxID=107327 RepID=A0A244CTD5_PSEDV|nr:FAD-binding protein [Pseudoalteromonas ulvae]OUL58865.1 hypothetical protein B1199_00850 [Pseudoalteromonas ulvae]